MTHAPSAAGLPAGAVTSHEHVIRTEARRLRRYAGTRVVSVDSAIDARFRRLGFSAMERRCMLGITAVAAIRLIARHDVAAFAEEVRYRGRRLAKLGLTPAAVIEALRESGEVAARVFVKSETALAQYVRLRDNLNFITILALNSAYHAEREAESRAFYDLFRVERDSPDLAAMLDGFRDVLLRYTGAEAALIRLHGNDSPSHARVRKTRLREPLCYDPARRNLADPDWERRFAQCWAVPLRHSGATCGLMIFGFPRVYPWLPRERELLTGAAERCALAAERVRLCTDLREKERTVRELATRVAAVEEHERRRISRELHDETGQSLLCVRLKLDMIESALPDGLPSVASQLAEARAMCEHSIAEVRRLIAALSPAVLEQMGLAAAIRQLTARFRDIHPARVRLSVPRRLHVPRQTALAAYRLLQEILNNAAKYSFATEVKISLQTSDQYLTLRAEDNGVGFDVEAALARTDCFGLSGMRERVALLGGTFSIRSTQGPDRRKAVFAHDHCTARVPLARRTVIDITLPATGAEP